MFNIIQSTSKVKLFGDAPLNSEPQVCGSIKYPSEVLLRREHKYYLLNVRFNEYNWAKDKTQYSVLYITYYDTMTKKNILDIFLNPLVPYFISKKNQTKYVEYVNVEDTYIDYYNSSKTKEELNDKLCSSYKYIEIKRGVGNSKVTEELKIKNKENYHQFGYLFNPNAFMLDVKLENFVIADFHINRFKMVDGITVTELPEINDLRQAAFDIETSMGDDGEENNKINFISLVDKASNTAYGFYLKDKAYKNENLNHQEIIDKIHRDLENALEGSNKECKKICGNYKNVKVILEPFDKEADLIDRFCRFTFDELKPHILTAFNATFDLGKMQRRIEELGMPIGTLNSKKFINMKPSFMHYTNKNMSGKDILFRGDCINPTGDGIGGSKKASRSVVLDNISETVIMDTQTLFYNIRKQNAGSFSNFSLNATATSVLGVTKLDYSDITDHITKLPYECFKTHIAYGIIDSMLLPMIDDVTSDISTVLTLSAEYCEGLINWHTAGKLVPSMVMSQYLYSGIIMGNNINSNLAKLKTAKERQLVGDSVGINIHDQYILNQRNKRLIGGGLVSDPFKNFYPVYPLESKSVTYKVYNMFKYFDTTYIDASSHYPTAIEIFWLGKGGLYAVIVGIRNETKHYTFLRTPESNMTSYKSAMLGDTKVKNNFGDINISIASNDMVSLLEKCNSMPSLMDIIHMKNNNTFELPVKVEKVVNRGIEIPIPRKYKELIALLSGINGCLYTSSTKKMRRKDNKFFLFESNSLEFHNMLVEYHYNGMDLKEAFNTDIQYGIKMKETLIDFYKYKLSEEDSADEIAEEFDSDDVEMEEIDYAELKLNKKTDDDDYDLEPMIGLQRAYDFKDQEFIPFPMDYLKRLHENKLYSETTILNDNVKLIMSRRGLYFPFASYYGRGEKAVEGKHMSNITNIVYRSKSDDGDKVGHIEFKYDINLDGVSLTICQLIDVLN